MIPAIIVLLVLVFAIIGIICPGESGINNNSKIDSDKFTKNFSDSSDTSQNYNSNYDWFRENVVNGRMAPPAPPVDRCPDCGIPRDQDFFHGAPGGDFMDNNFNGVDDRYE